MVHERLRPVQEFSLAFAQGVKSPAAICLPCGKMVDYIIIWSQVIHPRLPFPMKKFSLKILPFGTVKKDS